jgi:tetratricopeptide (TPR) repeat protein
MRHIQIVVIHTLMGAALHVNGLHLGSSYIEFASKMRSIVSRKNIATVAISTSLFAGMVPLPLHLSNAFADETTSAVKSEVKKGSITIEGEAARIFRKALQCESDGDLAEAQDFFQQVVEVEPDYIYAWSNLGNVLTSRGNLNEALLCYKKAISLYPPREALSAIVLNKASIEMAIGKTDEAIKDLDAAERLAGPQPSILTTKAVALTNDGRWADASTIFEKVISTADRNALPWWLRYSMALLETNRGKYHLRPKFDEFYSQENFTPLFCQSHSIESFATSSCPFHALQKSLISFGCVRAQHSTTYMTLRLRQFF